MPASTRSCASGSRSSASSAACERVQRVLVGPQQQRRRGRSARSGRAARGAARTRPARARTSPTSARGSRCRRRRRTRGGRGRAPPGSPRALSFTPSVGPERAPRAVAEHAVEARGPRAARVVARHARAARRRSRRPVQAVGHQRRACAGCELRRLDARAAGPRRRGRGRRRAAAGRATSTAERGHHLGEPVERVRVARAVLGVAVQRQVGQHEPEAVAEVLDDRLPLAVAEERRVQRARAPARCPPRGRRRARRRGGGRGAASPGRLAGRACRAASAPATGAAPASTTTRAELSTRRCELGVDPGRALRAAPRRADEVAEAERRLRVAALGAVARSSAARVSTDARGLQVGVALRARDALRQPRAGRERHGLRRARERPLDRRRDTVHAASSGGGSPLPHPAAAPSAARASRAASRRGMGGSLRPPTTVAGSAPLGLRPRDRPPRAARARRARGRAAVPARRHGDRRPPRARRSSRRSRWPRRSLSTLVSLCIFLTYGTTAHVARLHGAGAGPGGGALAAAGAVARARPSA